MYPYHAPFFRSEPVLAGLFLVGTAVWSDSPTEATAFWGNRNFSPSAMAGAKFGLTFLVLAIALIGQLIALRAFHLVGWETVAPLGESALQFGAAMLAVMCLAAMAKGESTFGTLMLVLFGLYVFPTVLALSIGRHTVAQLSTIPIRLLSAALVGALIVWVYRTRDTRMATRRVGLALVAIAVLLAGSKPDDRSAGELPDNMARPAFALGDSPAGRSTSGTNRSTLNVSLVIPPLPADLRFVLQRPTVSVKLRDGSVLRLETVQKKIPLSVQSNGSPTPALPGIHLTMPSDSVNRIAIAAPVTEQQRAAIDAGVMSVTLDGQVTVTRALASGALPLTNFSNLDIRGRRLWIDSIRYDNGAPQLDITMTSIGKYSRDAQSVGANGGGENTTTFALINRSLGQMQGLSIIGGTTVPGAVLLPAMTTAWERRKVGIRPGAVESWMRSAELLVVTHEPLGSYSLHLERPNVRFASRTP